MRSRELNASYLERKLRAIGLIGSSPLQDLSDIQGLLVLENDRPEWRFAANELLWCTYGVQSAVAAEQFALLIQNPPNSGILSIITGLVGVDADMQIFAGNNDPNVIAPPWSSTVVAPRDTRAFGGGTGLVSSAGTRTFTGTLTAAEVGTLTAGAVTIDRFDAAASGPLDDRVYVLHPGYYLLILAIVANAAADAVVHGYERPLEGKWEMK